MQKNHKFLPKLTASHETRRAPPILSLFLFFISYLVHGEYFISSKFERKKKKLEEKLNAIITTAVTICQKIKIVNTYLIYLESESKNTQKNFTDHQFLSVK